MSYESREVIHDRMEELRIDEITQAMNAFNRLQAGPGAAIEFGEGETLQVAKRDEADGARYLIKHNYAEPTGVAGDGTLEETGYERKYLIIHSGGTVSIATSQYDVTAEKQVGRNAFSLYEQLVDGSYIEEYAQTVGGEGYTAVRNEQARKVYEERYETTKAEHARLKHARETELPEDAMTGEDQISAANKLTDILAQARMAKMIADRQTARDSAA